MRFTKIPLLFLLLAALAGCAAESVSNRSDDLSQTYLELYTGAAPNQHSDYYLTLPDAHGRTLLNVPYLSQAERMPTGCELVSAAMLLHFWGYDLTPEEFAAEHIPFSPNPSKQNGQWYGASPNRCFIGDPFSPNGYGCFAPVIQAGLEQVISEKLQVCNLTGTPLSQLESTLHEGNPLLIWVTMDMKPVSPGTQWYLPDGSLFQWPSGEHCVVLVGYDADFYYCNDPLVPGGMTAYPKALVHQRYEELGRQALLIRPICT